MLPAALALILVVIGLFIVLPAWVRHRHVVHEREQTTAEDSTARVLDRTAREIKKPKQNKAAVPLLARGQTQSVRLEPGAVKELTSSSSAMDDDAAGGASRTTEDSERSGRGSRDMTNQPQSAESWSGFQLRPGALWALGFLLVGCVAPVVSLLLAALSVVKWWVFGASTLILPLVAFVLRRNTVRRLDEQRLQRAERRRIERRAQQNVQRATEAGLSEADPAVAAAGDVSPSPQKPRIIDLRAEQADESAATAEEALVADGESFTDVVDVAAGQQSEVTLNGDVVDTAVVESDCVENAPDAPGVSTDVDEGSRSDAQEPTSTGSEWSPRPVPKPSYQMKQKVEYPLAASEAQVSKKRRVDKADTAPAAKTPEKAEKADVDESSSPTAPSLSEQPVKYRRAIKDLSAVMDERRRAV